MPELPDAKLIGSLLENEEWKESFEKSIDRRIDEKRKDLAGEKRAQVVRWIDRQLTGMYIIAEEIREEYPESAKAIDRARKKLAELLH